MIIYSIVRFREITPSLVGGDVRLTYVQEERARQGREVEFDVQDEEEDTQEAEPDTYFQQLTRVGHNVRREQDRGGHGYETLAKIQ
jgi:hypothetical protein